MIGTGNNIYETTEEDGTTSTNPDGDEFCFSVDLSNYNQRFNNIGDIKSSKWRIS